jgi:Mn-containing catalase
MRSPIPSRWAAPGSAPAPDPKLYATYDGRQGEPSGPALGTETGLAGKIKDALT